MSKETTAAEDDTRTKALDVDACAYDNCYDRVYGVVQSSFQTKMFEGDTDTIGEKEHILFVNVPLCKVHFRQVPANEYVWEDKDWNGNE